MLLKQIILGFDCSGCSEGCVGSELVPVSECRVCMVRHIPPVGGAGCWDYAPFVKVLPCTMINRLNGEGARCLGSNQKGVTDKWDASVQMFIRLQ